MGTYAVGDRVRAFHPRTMGVIYTGIVVRTYQSSALIDFGLYGKHRVHLDHIVSKEA